MLTIYKYFPDGNGLIVYYDNQNNCEENKDSFTWKIENDQLLIFPSGEDPDNTIFDLKINGDVAELTRPLKRWEAGEFELNVTQLKFFFKKK
ncbi:hypothetical protein K5I29_02565 [Flavobacterium agricola]|uniref:Lipocalin-like domain-containing protein n=1 Tax=Flavobacterium agricola TaxID=2870839 RepID=A0ABY6M414_9FLAO|nr:lipocalin family protein [Flavobacterium agricola]UYW01823.1 hypothetical protein K5I29_02565 [Flavobacterium agricola]